MDRLYTSFQCLRFLDKTQFIFHNQHSVQYLGFTTDDQLGLRNECVMHQKGRNGRLRRTGLAVHSCTVMCRMR